MGLLVVLGLFFVCETPRFLETVGPLVRAFLMYHEEEDWFRAQGFGA